MEHRVSRETLLVCDMPPSADVRGSDGAHEIYQLCYEQDSGVIRTTVRGFWTIEDTDAYFARLATYIDAGRRRFGSVRVLVDRRGNPVQSTAVALRMQEANRALYKPSDRLAIVVDSSLVKMQLRRLFTHEGSKAFLSYEAAITWLRAHPLGNTPPASAIVG